MCSIMIWPKQLRKTARVSFPVSTKLSSIVIILDILFGLVLKDKKTNVRNRIIEVFWTL